MTKPVTHMAQIALEYPDKLYVGTFERSSRFEAHVDPTGVAPILERPGAEDVRKSVHMHIKFGLLADISARVGSDRRSPSKGRRFARQCGPERHSRSNRIG